GRRRLHRPGPAGAVDGPAGRPVGGDASAPRHVPRPRLGSEPVLAGQPPVLERAVRGRHRGPRGCPLGPGPGAPGVDPVAARGRDASGLEAGRLSKDRGSEAAGPRGPGPGVLRHAVPPPGRLRTLAEAPSGGRGLRVVPGGLRAAGAVAAVAVARTRRAIAGSNDAGRRGGAPIPRLRPVAVRATARCGERTRPEAGSPPVLRPPARRPPGRVRRVAGTPGVRPGSIGRSSARRLLLRRPGLGPPPAASGPDPRAGLPLPGRLPPQPRSLRRRSPPRPRDGA